MAILQVIDLHKTYKKGFIPRGHEVLKGVSFNIEPSTITGFLGGNGAGKTTTLKCLLELAYPTSGKVLFFDGQPLSTEVKKRIGFLPERPYFYDYLTGEEFLKFYARLSQTNMTAADMNERIGVLLKKVDLTHARHRKLREYSKGMLQKIGLAQALIHRPELAILDEPMAGLDPDGRFYLAEIIKEVASEGTAVFFSSHLLNDVERLCQNLIVLKDGVVSFKGLTQNLVNKMGFCSSILYSSSSGQHSKKVQSQDELQTELKKLVNEGALILEVRPERNLEEAFVKWGLRGEDQV